MRGIEGALFVLRRVKAGRLVSEALRSLGGEIAAPELSLAASLAYAVLRRESLWRALFGAYVKKERSGKPQGLDPTVSDCLLLGTAGILELKNFAKAALVNGLLEILKSEGRAKAVPMVNAILRNVDRGGLTAMEKLYRSSQTKDRALWAGVPEWTLPTWNRSWNNEELFELFELMQIPPRGSLRVAPGKRGEVLDLLKSHGMEGVPSDLFPESIRLASTVLPTLVPGFDRGLVTMQTEGSMLAASLVTQFARPNGLVLDMCSGRGVKAGQIAQFLNSGVLGSGARLECWELSSERHLAAVREIERLGIQDRVTLRLGNALSLVPPEKPSVILLDVPCTGSGTWNRKPESKWKLSWAKLDKFHALQSSLLRRALTLAEAGGIIIYVTCSLLRQENENIVAEALANQEGCIVLDVPWEGSHLRRGRPWGTYIWPNLPWLDGFYASIIMKRAGA
ncbi:MAG: RsmB/NOP family class I SAM-dependent RNA methyltransferase [Synergistaceae bacterium]|nr:RsmB/NOP family class I SAM-dependent RNA methyltransferase [Synergistaceae bacterium]